jgi:hypothetical protein
MKKCPHCAENIKDEAIKCRFCGEFLTNDHRQEYAGNHKVVILAKPKAILGIRPLMRLIGGIGTIVGLLLTATIVGSPFGLPMFAISFAMLSSGGGFKSYKCPYCTKKLVVTTGKENQRCKKCKNMIVVNWINGQKAA